MIKTTILVALLASTIFAQNNVSEIPNITPEELCQSNCVAIADNTLLTCGTDGNPYNSICKARCRDQNVQAAFVCNANYLYSRALCAPKCQRNRSCRASCLNAPRSENGYICASDALIYPTQCEVDCNLVRFAVNLPGNDQANLDSCLAQVNLLFGQPSGTAAPNIKK